MNLTIENTTNFILACIALCGETSPRTSLTALATDSTWNRKSLQLIQDHQASNRTKMLRIKNPKGINTLREIDEDLVRHFFALTSNGKTPGGSVAKSRYSKIAKGNAIMIRNNIFIDNIILCHQPNNFGKAKKTEDTLDEYLGGSRIFEVGKRIFSEDGKIVSFERMISNLDPTNAYFYNSKILKNTQLYRDPTNRLNLSKSIGELFAANNSYLVYYVLSDSEYCTSGSESLMQEHLFNSHIKAYGQKSALTQKQKHGKGQGIVFTDDISLISTLHEKGRKLTEFSPARIMSDYYILNTADLDLPLAILCSASWEDTLVEALYGTIIEEIPDGIVNNISSYEFLSCNFGKIKQIRKSSDKNIHIYCYKWQEEVLRQILKDKTLYLDSITDSQEEILYNFFSKQNK